MYNKKRFKVSKKQSRKNFKRGHKVKRVNHGNTMARGGMRF